MSGIKPTGQAHIGNYLGMMKLVVELQNSGKYDCFYFIADYHAMTQKSTAKERTEDVINIAADLLAAGVQPEKATLFVQSQVPGHTDLTWIFNTLTSMGELERMVEYKEKVSEGQTPNAGLFDYPVLMAADILIYKAKFVPVGDDQRQHLELTRTIARSFNSAYGKTFDEPQPLLAKAPRVMSVNDVTKKMSKSIPSGCIYLSDSPEIIKKKIMSAQTDSLSEVGYDPENRPGVANLLRIYAEFTGTTPEKAADEFRGKKYVEFKRAVSDAIITELAPFQRRREAIIKDKKGLMRILKDGTERAGRVAAKTMEEVRGKVGLI